MTQVGTKIPLVKIFVDFYRFLDNKSKYGNEIAISVTSLYVRLLLYLSFFYIFLKRKKKVRNNIDRLDY